MIKAPAMTVARRRLSKLFIMRPPRAEGRLRATVAIRTGRAYRAAVTIASRTRKRLTTLDFLMWDAGRQRKVLPRFASLGREQSQGHILFTSGLADGCGKIGPMEGAWTFVI